MPTGRRADGQAGRRAECRRSPAEKPADQCGDNESVFRRWRVWRQRSSGQLRRVPEGRLCRPCYLLLSGQQVAAADPGAEDVEEEDDCEQEDEDGEQALVLEGLDVDLDIETDAAGADEAQD